MATETAKGTSRAAGDWRARLPFFYGWIILGGSLIALGLTYSVMYSFSVFYVALLEEFGWGRGEAAGIYSVFMIVTGLGALVSGALSDRFGPGRVLAAGALCLGIGLMLASRTSALWHLYLSFGLVAGLGVSLAGWTPCAIMVSQWFSVRLGLALGIASGGIGVGIMALVPLVQFLIGSLGWRSAYVALAGIVCLGLLPMGLFVLRGRPEDLGQPVDGIAPESAQLRKSGARRTRKEMHIVDAEWANRAWTVPTAVRTMRLWLLSAVKLLGGVATQMIFVHQVVFLVENGYDRMLAASVVGIIGFLSVGAKVLWGWAADNIGREMTYTLGCGAMIVAVGLLALAAVAPSPAVLYLYAAIFALGYGVSAPMWPIVTSDLFAGRKFGSIYGVISVFSGFGNALGAWVGGFVYDLTGSYAIAFGVAIAAKAASAGALWIVAPRKVRRVRLMRGA